MALLADKPTSGKPKEKNDPIGAVIMLHVNDKQGNGVSVSICDW